MVWFCLKRGDRALFCWHIHIGSNSHMVIHTMWVGACSLSHTVAALSLCPLLTLFVLVWSHHHGWTCPGSLVWSYGVRCFSGRCVDLLKNLAIPVPMFSRLVRVGSASSFSFLQILSLWLKYCSNLSSFLSVESRVKIVGSTVKAAPARLALFLQSNASAMLPMVFVSLC